MSQENGKDARKIRGQGETCVKQAQTFQIIAIHCDVLRHQSIHQNRQSHRDIAIVSPQLRRDRYQPRGRSIGFNRYQGQSRYGVSEQAIGVNSLTWVIAAVPENQRLCNDMIMRANIPAGQTPRL